MLLHFSHGPRTAVGTRVDHLAQATVRSFHITLRQVALLEHVCDSLLIDYFTFLLICTQDEYIICLNS